MAHYTNHIGQRIFAVIVLAVLLVSVSGTPGITTTNATAVAATKPPLLIETPSGLLGWDCPNRETCGYFWFSEWGARKGFVDFSKEDWRMTVANPALGLYLAPYEDTTRNKITLAMFKDNDMVWIPPVNWGELWWVGSHFGNPTTPTPDGEVLLTVMLGYEKMTRGGAVGMSTPLYFSTEDGHFVGIPSWVRTE